MSAAVRKRGYLLNLAAEGMAPAVSGCASSPSTETAIDRFGLHIVSRWLDWLSEQPLAVRRSAIGELADLPAARARIEAVAAIDSFAANASIDDRARAVEYLCALPRFSQRALVLDPSTGGFALPSGVAPDDFLALLGLLPIDVPPYSPGSILPDTPYTLNDLAGGGSLGVFYRGTDSSGSPLLIKVCTDPAQVALLRQHAGRITPPVSNERWSDRLVRLVALELAHPTPFVVWEHAPSGDLTMLLTNLKHQTGRGLSPEDVFRLIEQIVEGLGFAHALGMVHGDLKPANVLVSGDTLRLADLGAGIATAAHAVTHSEIGEKAFAQLKPSEQVRVVRGLGSRLYLSPEQQREEIPGPRDDLYSLGVLWDQLLIGDFTRPLQPDWKTELEEKHHVPQEHSDLIARCIGPWEGRPRDGGALLALMRPQEPHSPITEQRASSVVSPEEVRIERMRKQALFQGLKEFRGALRDCQEQRSVARRVTLWDIGVAFLLALLAVPLLHYFPGPKEPIYAGWLLIGFVLWIRLRLRKKQDQAGHLNLIRLGDRLAQEHPDDIQSWGGATALFNPDALVEIIGAMEEDMRTLSPEIEREPPA
jgi:hypothetical protein